MNPTILCLDPGLATLGVAVVELLQHSERPLFVQVLTTKKASKKAGVLVASDDIARIRYLLTELNAIVATYDPSAICAELPSGSKGARAAAALGIAKAIVASMSVQHDLPLAACSPQQLKKAVTGNAGASKDEVQAHLEKRYGSIRWPQQRTLHEHASDALGAFVACRSSDVVMTVRRMGRAVEAAE
jgi:crossover junction endodeoxyribonuclease RuvC